MESNSVLSDYYRLRFNDALRGRLELSASQIRNEVSKPVVVTDVFTLSTIKNPQVAAYDPGEAQHGPLDQKSLGDTSENSIPLKPLDQVAILSSVEYTQRYRVMSTLDHSDMRKKMEDRVRRSKRAGLECPFKDENGQCTSLFIRCGDRLQFSMRENGRERAFFHKCTYDWRARGNQVLIIDDDQTMLDFCASAFSLFMSFDKTRIRTASSVGQAIDILMRSKIEGGKFGLVITDILMPGRSGYDLVNELYDRNFDVEVVLMKEEREIAPFPAGYRGTAEVLPNRPFVSGILVKPFHSEILVMEVEKLRFNSQG